MEKAAKVQAAIDKKKADAEKGNEERHIEETEENIAYMASV